MDEQTLLAAYHALQQRRVREWNRLDSVPRHALSEAIDEVRHEIVRYERERKRFATSRGLLT